MNTDPQNPVFTKHYFGVSTRFKYNNKHLKNLSSHADISRTTEEEEDDEEEIVWKFLEQQQKKKK